MTRGLMPMVMRKSLLLDTILMMMMVVMMLMTMAMMMLMTELTCTPIAFHTLRCTLWRISGPSRNRPLRKPEKKPLISNCIPGTDMIMIMKVLVMITKNVT